MIVRSQTDPAYFDNLIGKSLDKFDIGAFVPPTAAKWVKAEPEVARMMVLATDMGDMQRDLADSQKLMDRIQHVMEGKGEGRNLPRSGVAAHEVDRDDEPAGRHAAAVRRTHPRRSSNRC